MPLEAALEMSAADSGSLHGGEKACLLRGWLAGPGGGLALAGSEGLSSPPRGALPRAAGAHPDVEAGQSGVPKTASWTPQWCFFFFFLTIELQNSRTVVFATCRWVQSSAFLDVGEDSVSTCKPQSKGYRVHFVRLATRPPAQGQGPFKQKSLSPTEMEIELKSVIGTG